MDREKTIHVLNTLIEINKERIEGYQAALKKTEEKDLRNLFSEFIKTSKHFNSELIREVHNMGGNPLNGTKTFGNIFNGGTNGNGSYSNKDRKAILSSCEKAEDMIREAYHNLLIKNLVDINSDQHAIISEQHYIIRADHDKIKNMRDLVLEHN